MPLIHVTPRDSVAVSDSMAAQLDDQILVELGDDLAVTDFTRGTDFVDDIPVGGTARIANGIAGTVVVRTPVLGAE